MHYYLIKYLITEMCTRSHQTQPKLPLKRVSVSVAPTHCTSVSTTRAFPTTIHVLVIPHSSVMHTVRDTENLPFSADTPRWFSEGCRAAIRGSSARQCADAPRIYTMRNPRMSAKAYALNRRRVLAAEAVSLQSPYH